MRDVQVGIRLRHAAHLVKRFFGYLTASDLSEAEREEVATLLSTELATLFFGMQQQDQRHSYEVYRRSGGGPSTQAALLHDVGKSLAPIGPIRRSLATVCSVLHIPTKGTWRMYLDHGAIGADLLARSGADALAVAFTRHHPGPPPAGVDPGVWKTLSDADNR